jgi:hypothetical protein
MNAFNFAVYPVKSITMTRSILFVFMLWSFLSCTVRKQTGASDWIQLFNGKDLNDWIIKIKDHPIHDNWANTFRVEDGVLKVRYDGYQNFNRQYGHIYYKRPFSYYLLVMEYRFVGDQAKGGEGWALRNSGAMLHCQPPRTIAVEQDFPISLEMQLLGGNGSDLRTTGNLCTPGTNVVLHDTLFTPHCVNSTSDTYHGDQWVRAEMLVFGDSLMQHIVEGDTVLSYRQPQYDERDGWVKKAGYKGGEVIRGGYIALQSESHPVEFRNVRLFNLEPYKSNPEKLKQTLRQLQERKGE